LANTIGANEGHWQLMKDHAPEDCERPENFGKSFTKEGLKHLDPGLFAERPGPQLQ
jgi:hypothetical protein